MMEGALDSCLLPPLGAKSPHPEYRCGRECSPPEKNCEEAPAYDDHIALSTKATGISPHSIARRLPATSRGRLTRTPLPPTSQPLVSRLEVQMRAWDSSCSTQTYNGISNEEIRRRKPQHLYTRTKSEFQARFA